MRDCGLPRKTLRSAVTSSVSWRRKLFRQDFLEKIQGSRIAALSQPEDGLFSNHWIPVGAGQVDQQRHALTIMHLGKGKDRLLLHFGFGIVLNGSGDLLRFLAAADLRQPEDRLAANSGAGIGACHGEQIFHRLRLFALRECKCGFLAETVVWIRLYVLAQQLKSLLAALHPQPQSL